MKTPWMRGAIYFFVLCYLFIGVAIVSDVFMEAIEVITSQEREMPGPNGTTYTVR
jgi:solute carrier family 8 (sodium/calcium exchanger)